MINIISEFLNSRKLSVNINCAIFSIEQNNGELERDIDDSIHYSTKNRTVQPPLALNSKKDNLEIGKLTLGNDVDNEEVEEVRNNTLIFYSWNFRIFIILNFGRFKV